MVTNQSRSNRKPSGGRYKKLLVRRQHESGGMAALTRIDTDKTRTNRTQGGNSKLQALGSKTADVLDPSTGKHAKATITSVKDNPANRHFVRRNIITKGAIVVTDKGEARVTSRPGQNGVVQAVLLK